MRIDKLTTKFQQALSEAQSIALAKDNQYIEPAHLLLAMLRDSDGAAKSLLIRAGVNVAGLEKGVEKSSIICQKSRAPVVRCRSAAIWLIG